MATSIRKLNKSTRSATTAVKNKVAKPRLKSMEQKAPRLRIRMYRHGLGDCLLLRFARPGKDTFNVLIDCGLITVARNSKKTMIDLVEDIAATCPRLDVVAMTHEHWDHASGFSKQQAQDIFQKIEIGEVWYAWTEDPQHELGQRLRNERAEKVAALTQAVGALGKIANSPLAVARAKGIGNILGFFGLSTAANGTQGEPIGKTRAAFEYLMKRPGIKTRFCYPDKAPISLGDVENVRAFVLGPPQNEVLIKKSAPTKSGREVYEMATESNLTNNLTAAFARLAGASGATNQSTEDCPFDEALRRRAQSRAQRTQQALEILISETWDKPGEEWRRAEEDWTQAAETLALNLDSHTNNTCLVLAFEFTDTGEVFLFPADAQVGNWLSWQELKWKVRNGSATSEITAQELLTRTVFYKVGHHGSHNATLRALGLEQMTSEELIAFIPVVKDQAMKNRWTGMPFVPLVKRLNEKTRGRLLQSDKPPPDKADLAALSTEAREEFLSMLTVGQNDLYFEYNFGGIVGR